MSAALIAGLCFSGAFLLVTAYFFMGSVPLLILKHDTTMDARFVRGFFNVYYLAAMSTAAAAAVSYALAAVPLFAAGAAALAVLALVLRRKVMPRMDALQAQIAAGGGRAVAMFRRIHVALVLVNLAQVVLIVWTLIAVSMQQRGP